MALGRLRAGVGWGRADGFRALRRRRPKLTVDSPSAYFKALRSGQPARVQGLVGCVIKGEMEEDFRRLAFEPGRELALLAGPDGLEKLIGRSGRQILVELRYPPEDIARLVDEQGFQFRLVVFPAAKGVAFPGTWDGVANLVASLYPVTTRLWESHLATLKRLEFDEFEQASGFSWKEVDRNGRSDPRFMTRERLRESARTATDLRAFLYFVLRLNEQFSGNGYTLTDDGRQGFSELVTRNSPIAMIAGAMVLPLEIPRAPGRRDDFRN